MKKVSIVIPTFNEEENVQNIAHSIIDVMKPLNYDFDIIFIDNFSLDSTRVKIEELCQRHSNIKAIFNSRNFGQLNSPYYGLLQSTGDCGILIAADFQDPVELIPQFLSEWENGYKIVIGIKTSSKENKLMYFLRSQYYKIIKSISNIEQIEHFTGFGLYDKSFIDLKLQYSSFS